MASATHFRARSLRLTFVAILAMIVAANAIAPSAGAASPKRSGRISIDAHRETRKAVVDSKTVAAKKAKVTAKTKAPTAPRSGGATTTTPISTPAPEIIQPTPVVETIPVSTPTPTPVSTPEHESTPITTPTETTPTKPTTPTESTEAAAAGRLFTGNKISSFPMNQSAPGAVTEVPNPTGGSETAFQMTVSNSDVYPITPTENPRAQLVSPAIFEPGDEFWWHSKFLLPASFPTSVPGWLTVMEGPYGAPYNGTPPWHIEVNGESIRWQRNSEYKSDIPWEMPLVKGQWIEVLMHCRFANEGFVEMWVDGQQITFFKNTSYNPNHVAQTTKLNMKTRDSSNDGGPNFAVIQSYRLLNMFSSVTLFQGPMLIGSTRASVES